MKLSIPSGAFLVAVLLSTSAFAHGGGAGGPGGHQMSGPSMKSADISDKSGYRPDRDDRMRDRDERRDYRHQWMTMKKVLPIMGPGPVILPPVVVPPAPPPTYYAPLNLVPVNIGR
jgi:hypothetical protein